MRSIELFSGCGGLALGLSKAGFHHEAMVEWDADAVATVHHNRQNGVRFVRDWPLRRSDVREINWKQYGGKISLAAGGPPCQPFSIGGKHWGQLDARDMWPEAIRAVRETLPQAFLFENVRGIARPAFAEYLRWILEHLRHPNSRRRDAESHVEHTKRLGSHRNPEYQVIVLKVNAADFGAPQKRQRVIIAGVRTDMGAALLSPPPSHSRDRLLWDQWVTGEYWARHGIEQPSPRQISSVDQALVRRLRQSSSPPAGKPWTTVRDALVGLGEPSGEANHVFQAGARVYPGHTGSLLDQPAKALKAGDHGVPGGENMMVRADGTVRYFTVREAARLQGLPDDFIFPRSWTESMRQLGNAVPTQLGEAMGRWMARILDKPRIRRFAA